MSTDAAARLTETQAFIEAVGEPAGGVWLIRVIRAGESGNRNYYPDAVLRDAVRLVEGARVFEKSDAEHVAAGTQAIAPGNVKTKLAYEVELYNDSTPPERVDGLVAGRITVLPETAR